MSGDKLIINCMSYTVNDLNKLPADLAPYLAAQKENTEYIAFHGKLSPWSNFHRSPFVFNDQQCHNTEHLSILYMHSIPHPDHYAQSRLCYIILL